MNFMDIKQISPDQVVFFQYHFITLNLTIVFTWAVMVLLVIGSWLVTRRLSTGQKISAWQNILEILVTGIQDQISEISRQKATRYMPFIGTLFVFIAACNLLTVVPGYESPTASLSTTAALAICVFISVPLFGIAKKGLGSYLKQYIQPTVFMLPFNIMGELSRTLALAVRLFGNIMSGSKIVAILLAIIPFVFPVILQLLGLLTGLIQAYIFAVLAMVYIASATQIQEHSDTKTDTKKDDNQ
jgi:F-type H+-transporting ATPase subunit a